MTIKSKLIINNLLAAAIMLALLVTGWLAMQKMADLQDKSTQDYRAAVLTTDLSRIGMALYQTIADAEINRDIDSNLKEFADKKKRHLDRLEKAAKTLQQPEEKKELDEIAAAYNKVVKLFETEMAPLLKNSTGMTPEIQRIDGLIDKELKVIRDNALLLTDAKIKAADTSDKQIDKTLHASRTIMSGIGIVALIILFIFAGWIITSIMKPLHALRSTLVDISQGEGDLTRCLSEHGRDELAEISCCFNLFTSKLRGIIGQVAQTAGQVASASSQLHSTAEKIATGSEQVASQTSTVATASEEMAATSGDIANSCQLTSESAGKAEAAASESAFIVMESVNIMNSIAEQVRESAETVSNLGHRSEQIGDIVSTIEDIADQTNLLALNAAIEAARAGEQGRGFAVVADEVRALAERTTRATREISEMIKTIQGETTKAVTLMNKGVEEVENGVMESAKSSEALVDVLTQISDVSAQVGQIATAAEEQTATTNEITNNIQQMNNVVLESAQGASETATAAAELLKRATELQQLVGQFKLA